MTRSFCLLLHMAAVALSGRNGITTSVEAFSASVGTPALARSGSPSLPKKEATSPDDAAPPSSNDDALREMQLRHRPIASSFVPSRFNPHPALTNRHLQTISGVFLRKDPDCAYVDGGLGGASKVLDVLSGIQPGVDADARDFWDERRRIETDCKRDFYTVDVKYAGKRKTRYQSSDSEGMVILIHGLESNSNSSLSVDLARAYLDAGFDVACINFRGCCGSPNNSLGGYHLGFTDDLRHFLKLISESWEKRAGFYEERPIYLSGFSLGANVVVKCLGELGDAALSMYNVRGAAVTGAPFDAERNIKCLDSPGFNRVIYSANFLNSIKDRVQCQLDDFCDGDPMTELFDYEGAMSATTVAEIDNAYIAKVYGYEDNVDYYRQCSCYYFLPGVAVPLFIINARDDPFFDPGFFPVEESVDGGGLAPIKMERTEHGGHLGFMFHQRNKAKEGSVPPVASWMPMELARFIRHVHYYKNSQD